MRLLFAGSPALAVPSLELLVRRALADPASAVEVVGILTNPDTPKGRSGQLLPTEVGASAERLQAERLAAGLPAIPLLKPEKLDAAAREAVTALKPDLLVSVAYGRIFGPRWLALFPRGGINLHPSLLPRFRGATPIPAVILARENETGLSVQRLALAMDSGDILLQERWPLTGRETTADLSALAADRGAALVLRAAETIAAGQDTAIAQNESLASYCARIEKADGRIDWSLAAADIDARIRAFTPWPLAFTDHDGLTLFILEAAPYTGRNASETVAPMAPTAPGTVLGIDKAEGILVQTGDGPLAIKRLQYGGKKALDWRSFLNGARAFRSARLGFGETDARRSEVEDHAAT